MLHKNLLTGPRIVLFALIVSAISHLPFVDLGPRSVHVWRQSNTLAVARNFYLEEMDIMNPRVDRRLDTDGVTGMQFPSYEYIVACGYKIFGLHNWVHRIISLLISFWGAVGMYFLAKHLIKNDIAAGIAAVAYTFSPDLYYFGFSALPDILALACSVWGLYYFLNWFSQGQKTNDQGQKTNNQRLFVNYLLSLLFISLAGLTKLQFLAVGFFIAPYVIMKIRENREKKIVWLGLFGLVACVVPLLWYKRSVELIETSGLKDFGITFRPESDINKGIQTITQNLISDLPDLLLNYASFLVFLFSIYYFFKNRFWKSKWFIPMLCWTIALIIYHIIELAQMNVHSYYMMVYLPVLFLMIAYGARVLLNTKYASTFLLVFLILSPVLAAVRIIPSRFINKNSGIPEELYVDSTRNELISSVPNNELCIVGPDISGCIYFYHLEKKGFGFDNLSELSQVSQSGETTLENYVKRGAKYIYSNDSLIKENILIKDNFDLINTVGSFYVYKLKSY